MFRRNASGVLTVNLREFTIFIHLSLLIMTLGKRCVTSQLERLRRRRVSLLLLFFSYYYNNILTFIVVPYCFLHVLFRLPPDDELLSNSRRTSGTDCDSPRHQMEMLSFSIARTNFNKQTGTMTVYRGINFFNEAKTLTNN